MDKELVGQWYGTKISNMEFRLMEALEDEHEAVRILVDKLDEWKMSVSVSYGPRLVKQGIWTFFKARFCCVYFISIFLQILIYFHMYKTHIYMHIFAYM